MTSGSRTPDGGFTLTEMLVALLVISLSMAGLLQTVKMVSRYEQRLVIARRSAIDVDNFAGKLQAELLAQQPLESDTIDGDSRSLAYACEAGRRTGPHDCHLTAPGGSFTYISDEQTSNNWPMPDFKPGEVHRLEAVVWQNASGKTLAIVKLPVEQGSDCQFDMISRTCRSISAPETSAADSAGG